MKYTAENIKQIVGGSWISRSNRNYPIEQLLTDSRKLIFPETSVFFALQGARRDGHLFIHELYNRGVRCFIVDQKVKEKFASADIIKVENVLQALQDLAAFHRRQFNFPVIGISGSNGKTIVKEWLNQLLEDKYNIVRSPRSYNSQIGVPLSVWQMNDSNELAIFEAGISVPGEMKKLEMVIRPGIGVFTNIGEAHSEGFKSMEKKIKEKLLLFIHAKILIYCKDHTLVDETIRGWRGSKGPKLFTWGKRAGSVVRIRSMKKSKGSMAVRFFYNRKKYSLVIPFQDNASVENAMTCVCTLLHLNGELKNIQGKISKLAPVAMRLELKTGINNCSIINDSYSADISSLRIALDFLSQQQQHTKRTVILSDILQSGKEEKKLYKEVAQLLQQKKISRLIAIGQRISSQAETFRAIFSAQMDFFPSTEDFIKNVQQLSFRDETILIKGARTFQFEKIDALLSQQAHQTILEIDLNAMAGNLKQYQQVLRPHTLVMAMVKAFSYGTGSYEIASLLQFHKIDYLAVAYADEGTALRKSGIHIPIMVMNTEENSFDALLQYNLEPVIYSMRLFHLLDQFLKREGILQLPVHIEIESGMNRLGFSEEEIPTLAKMLPGTAFKVKSVFSHLAASEERQQDDFSSRQLAQLKNAADRIQSSVGYAFLRHIANSAAIVRHPEWQMDMVRLGIGLYGVDSAGSDQLNLVEVATLKSTIAQIKKLHAGETVGYNRKGLVPEEKIIATVRIGYADGYPRSLGNGAGKMLVRGRLAPTIGSICMDMTMIDISDIPGVEEGEEVIVFGKELPVQQVARWAGTIPYEMLTGVSQRVKRIYFEE